MSHESHPGEIKHKTLLPKNEVNAFSNRRYFYGHFEKKKVFKYLKNGRNGEENKSIHKKNTVLRYERLKFWDRFP